MYRPFCVGLPSRRVPLSVYQLLSLSSLTSITSLTPVTFSPSPKFSTNSLALLVPRSKYARQAPSVMSALGQCRLFPAPRNSFVLSLAVKLTGLKEPLKLPPKKACSLLVVALLMVTLVNSGSSIVVPLLSHLMMNGVPAGIEGVDPKSLLHEMVDDINVASQSEAIAIRLAQSAAVPYGQILNNDEMEAIINELFSCSNVNYTPDGKAILCILPQGDIEHLLG